MFNIVLFEPEIPPNTGNIIRLASNTGCRLHLIQPLGFSLDEKNLLRAGLDYHQYSTVVVHENWDAFINSCQPAKLYAYSTKGHSFYTNTRYMAGDYLVFVPETRGLPEAMLGSGQFDKVLTLPMVAQSRSLNLSNTVAIVVYEAWHQLSFAAAQTVIEGGVDER